MNQNNKDVSSTDTQAKDFGLQQSFEQAQELQELTKQFNNERGAEDYRDRFEYFLT